MSMNLRNFDVWPWACISHSMRIPTLVLISALSAFLMAADDKENHKTMTGCLTKDSAGGYLLTSEAGKKVAVKGSADLDKHSANHKVTLHGKEKMENGKTMFHAERVEHVSDVCTVPPVR